MIVAFPVIHEASDRWNTAPPSASFPAFKSPPMALATGPICYLERFAGKPITEFPGATSCTRRSVPAACRLDECNSSLPDTNFFPNRLGFCWCGRARTVRPGATFRESPGRRPGRKFRRPPVGILYTGRSDKLRLRFQPFDPETGRYLRSDTIRLAGQCRCLRKYVRQAMAATDGNITQAAKLLEVSRPTLHDLIRKHGLEEG
jgi:hypothetical protein